MAWRHSFCAETQILFVTVTGLVDRSIWECQLRASLQEANSHFCYRFLVDYRQAELRLHLVDLFDRPTSYQKAGMPHAARIAILYPPTEKDSEFIETVMENRGYAVKIFESEEKAIGWLSRRESRHRTGTTPAKSDC